MKKILSLFVFCLIVCLIEDSAVSAMDNPPKKGGRCTGSAYCTACSNCSRCGHCSSGGTCGVCSRSYSNDSYKPIKKTKHSTEKIPKTTGPTKTYNPKVDLKTADSILMVKTSVVNIRKKASMNAIVIEKAHPKERLIKIQKLNSWYKVRVEKTRTIGYVYFKNLE